MAYYIALPGLGNVLKIYWNRYLEPKLFFMLVNWIIKVLALKWLPSHTNYEKTSEWIVYCSYLELLCLVAESSIQLLKTVQSKIHLMLTNSIIQAYILEIILEGKYVPVDLRFVSYLGIKINAKNCSYWCPTLLAHLPVKSPRWKDVATLFYLYFVSSTR